jgi:hypothetical protein
MKPYAWINVNDEYKILFDDELPTYYPQAWMPLYTFEELTDEEITSLFRASSDHIEFARAILRKAQE